MLTSREAWRIISEHAPRDEWLKMRDVYALVQRHAELDDVDRRTLTQNGKSTRWQRTVRNALQRQKQAASVEWDAKAGFRLSSSAGAAASP